MHVLAYKLEFSALSLAVPLANTTVGGSAEDSTPQPMSYAKLFSSITESSLWSEPHTVRLLFISMLAKADSTGFVEAALPGLARISNLTMDETEQALKVLESDDPHSKDLGVNPDNGGKRVIKVPGGWMVLNYEMYRNRKDETERREWMRKYMAQYRKDLKDGKHDVNNVNSSKPQLAQAEAETETETETEGEAEANTHTDQKACALSQKKEFGETVNCDWIWGELCKAYRRPSTKRINYCQEYALAEVSRRPEAKEELKQILLYRETMTDKRYFPQSIDQVLQRWDELLDRSRNQSGRTGPKTIPEKELERAINRAKNL